MRDEWSCRSVDKVQEDRGWVVWNVFGSMRVESPITAACNELLELPQC